MAAYYVMWQYSDHTFSRKFMLTPQTRTIEILRGRYDPGTDTGYMGYIPASDFITGSELIDLLDFRDGVDQNSDAGWLKFYVGTRAACNYTGQEKCIFIAKQSLKNNISWDQINNAGLVYGTTSRTILGQSYNIRIMTGGEAGPGTESEWNELIYRVHAEQPESKSNWETFDTIETNMTGGDGLYTWCQETPPSKSTERVHRGILGLAGWYTATSSYSDTYSGWRPVLELVIRVS